MIANLNNGSDFSGLFRYLLAQEKKAKIILGNAAGETIKELSKEFAHCAHQRRTTQKPVKHLMIAFAPEDGFVRDEVKSAIAYNSAGEIFLIKSRGKDFLSLGC